MPEHERIAILETEIAHAKGNIDMLAVDIKEMMEYVKEHMNKEEEDRQLLLTKIENIEKSHAKMKYFWGGVVFTISAIWSVITAGLMFIGKSN